MLQLVKPSMEWLFPVIAEYFQSALSYSAGIPMALRRAIRRTAKGDKACSFAAFIIVKVRKGRLNWHIG